MSFTILLFVKVHFIVVFFTSVSFVSYVGKEKCLMVVVETMFVCNVMEYVCQSLCLFEKTFMEVLCL